MSKFVRLKPNFLSPTVRSYNSHTNVRYKGQIFPCNLGILFFGDISNKLFKRIKLRLNHIYDSFFYQIKKLKIAEIFYNSITLEAKYEFDMLNELNEEILIQSSNNFFKIINETMQKSNFEMGLGLTNQPIYSGSKENILFLFGEAHLVRNCAVVSTYNLSNRTYDNPDYFHLIELRILKESIHEIGHLLLGPNHCYNNLCVMSFSKTIRDIDIKLDDLCDVCKIKLSNIRDNYNF